MICSIGTTLKFRAGNPLSQSETNTVNRTICIKGMLRILFLLISLGGSTGLKGRKNYDEYDCDTNGSKDCSAWDYRGMKCSQPKMHATELAVQRICIEGAGFGLLGNFPQPY